ncbi:MAG: cation acetate symporter [Kiritimatiellae bacterium]|jgi:cation/acetate symporter|nr:cation acetate symporter [Kiritimatiellia bacterium]
MNYVANPIAIAIFLTFVGFVLGISFYFARKAKSAEGYFAAGGQIHWFVNGIAFAGDYLSAASFLGICGLIATMGYDGFLYSIGYLAGWMVALFVVAEPMKRLGKYTFTDALDYKFNSKGIQLMAAISTLAVSIFYLIPQMVGAGVLVTPLLGLPHWAGVVMVGIIVITIVATAGMTSTTYVQFLKGGLLIVFSTVLSIAVLHKGLSTEPRKETFDPQIIEASSVTPTATAEHHGQSFVKIEQDGYANWWIVEGTKLLQAQSKTITADGTVLYNGAPKSENKFKSVGRVTKLPDGKTETGPLGIFEYFSTIQGSEVVRYPKNKIAKFTDGGDSIQVFVPEITAGADLMIPGQKFKLKSGIGKLNFISLMLALFLGTASLPHILIRYYTVPSQRDARKSTIVAVAGIGFFYVLTLFMGLGAMTLGVVDLESSNMSAPLLAKAFSLTLFSIISAIAFATVLGTVSGLIVAASGAVAHDLIDNFMNIKMSEKTKVRAGKIAAVAVGIIAMALGIAFEKMNVAFLVGWAFAVAASANLPSIIMLLFWKKTTAKGIAWSIGVGMVSALGIILTSPSIYTQLYHLEASAAPHTLDNPGIISIPLSFLTLVVVSLMTQKKK